MLTYEELKERIENAQMDVSSQASDVLGYVLDRYDEDDDNIDEYDVEDAIMEECDEYFTYYDDAWEYLQENCITDFDDAVAEGCTGVCSIAYYYLRDEIMNILELY